jgi:hypothetical protein
MPSSSNTAPLKESSTTVAPVLEIVDVVDVLVAFPVEVVEVEVPRPSRSLHRFSYSSHLSAMTLPQVKHRTGMIIGDDVKSYIHPIHVVMKQVATLSYKQKKRPIALINGQGRFRFLALGP